MTAPDERPRISVVLPSRDGSRHLDEAVDSVVGQTFKAWELILVDDGSNDDTGARMEAWEERDARIRVLRLSPNRGLPAALNQGFRHARGELFTWTSDDNLLLPGALERMAERLDGDPDVDLVYADYVDFDEAGRERRNHAPSLRLLPLRPIVGCCFLYRREVHEEIGGFDERFFLAEDYDFWLRAAARFRFAAIPEVLYRYRLHESSLSSKHGGGAQLAAVRALDCYLATRPRPERAHTHLQRAQELFRRGQSSEARRLALRALVEAPWIALRGEHRRVLASCLIGHRSTRRIRMALGRTAPPPVRILLQDYLGGITAYCLNLAAARPDDGAALEWLWIGDDDPRHAHTPPDLPVLADRVARVHQRWPQENLFAVLRRMRRALGRSRGVIVANDLFGLAHAARFGRRDALVWIAHRNDESTYRLAAAFEPWIDTYVAVSAHIRDELVRRLPRREADIRSVRSGVRIPGHERVLREDRGGGPLRLAYCGRLDDVKGVLDLPEIDRSLRERGVAAHWTIIGDGPRAAALRSAFAAGATVRFTGALPHDQAGALLARHDVLVLPSRSEGLSLALLEAMAAGVVPVASDVPSGTREVIEPGSTGLLARPGDTAGFADAIARLAADPSLLARMSEAAVARVASRHSLEAFGAAFYSLLEDLGRRPIPYRPIFRRGPSRLDRPWLPNLVVRVVRRLAR